MSENEFFIITIREYLRSKDNGELADYIFKNFPIDRCNVCLYHRRALCQCLKKTCVKGITKYLNSSISIPTQKEE